ncbi:MAG TPA: SGNH/GDSL hydrolase family protein [Anaeromyxobacteraceae bacterium]|nr:SGNH/GDSL hydrolase family protein [Anaeromyxobacteraceae bacterium]
MKRHHRCARTLSLVAALLLASGSAGAADWIGTWSASMQAPLFGAPPTFDHVTLRQVVRITTGGSLVRVRFSNAIGSTPFTIGAASVGVRGAGAAVRAGTLRTLTFGGEPSITLPPGAVALSDAVALAVAPQSDLAVSLYLPAPSPGDTQLTLSHQTSYVSTAGDFTADATMPVASTVTSWFWLSGVEVLAGGNARAVVAFGDSITEGFNSTTDANARWPDVLARRLLAHGGTRDVAVLNEAISGNRVLNDEIGPNGQKRIDRDVLTQGGLAYAILLMGTNDMGFSQIPPGAFPPGVLLTNVSADEIIAGYRQIIRRVHEAGAKVYGGTILPFKGASYWDAGAEAKRETLNAFIRKGGAFDGVVEFDAVMRDPADPQRIRAEFDSGDHLHPNDAGYAAMGNAVDLRLFQAPPNAATPPR